MAGFLRRDVSPLMFSITAVLLAGIADSHAAEKAPLHVGWATSLVFGHTVARIHLPPREPPPNLWYQVDSASPMEIHVLRLGDVGLATNPFELFLDYGMRIKARSNGVLTFVVQLSDRCCGYLPTAKAVEGGGYGAVDYIIGPEGGQVLVDETVKRINALWE